MKSVALALLAIVFFAAAAQAKLELKDIKPVSWILGPERKTMNLLPFDELVFRFRIDGLKIDEQGKTNLSVNLVLTNANGKRVMDQNLASTDLLPLGGQSTFGQVHLRMGDNVPEGEFKFEVKVTDNLARESASFHRTLFGVRKYGLTIVSPQFFYDSAGQAPAPAGGLVGQTLHYRLKCIGFTKEQMKIDAEMSLHLLDEQGKETLHRPITIKLQETDPAKVEKAQYLSYPGEILLSRSGKFTLRIKVTDHGSGKSTVFETPLRVREP